MEAKRKRLTLDLDPPVQRRLKTIAAIKGISMRQYCLTAITRELSKDEAQGIIDLPSGTKLWTVWILSGGRYSVTKFSPATQ